MTARRCSLLCAPLLAIVLAAVLAGGGNALAARTYSDRVGDVKGGSGPDIASVVVSSTRTSVVFRVRFAQGPPLRANARRGWADMLLIGIDVPPFGPLPATPGGDWLGADFALGTHGPATTGQLVRLGAGSSAESRKVATFRIVTTGATATFAIPRRALGSPARFAFTVAAAREGQTEATGGGVDVAPALGTFRYTLGS